MVGDTVDLGQPLRPHLVDERGERVLVQPRSSFRQRGRRGQSVQRIGGSHVTEDVRFPEAGQEAVRQLQGEQPFMDDVAESVDDPRLVEVKTHRGNVFERVEAGALGEGFPPHVETVAAQGFEQRMPWCDPFQVVLLRRFPLRGEAGVARQELWKPPVQVALVSLQRGWCSAWLEGVRQAVHCSE